jgi:hypothetical protein
MKTFCVIAGVGLPIVHNSAFHLYSSWTLSGYRFGNLHLESCETRDKLRAVFYWLGDSYPAESNLCFEYAKMPSLINMKQERHKCRHDDNEFYESVSD